jgi:hypothetical protein
MNMNMNIKMNMCIDVNMKMYVDIDMKTKYSSSDACQLQRKWTVKVDTIMSSTKHTHLCRDVVPEFKY